MQLQNKDILCLDVGTKRVGVARANSIAQIAEPVKALTYSEAVAVIATACKEHSVGVVVVGLPQNSQGQDTEQTVFTRDFVKKLQHALHKNTAIVYFDESLSSQKAEARLQKTTKNYTKGDIDSHAASIILQEYLAANRDYSL